MDKSKCNRLENLIRSCNKKGLKTSVYYPSEQAKFVRFDVILEEDTARDVLKCMLSEAEKFGNTQINFYFAGKHPIDAERPKAFISIFSNFLLQSERLWERLENAISEGNIDTHYMNFSKILDLYDSLRRKNMEMRCQLKISAYCMYEIRFEISGTEDVTEVLFDKLCLDGYDDYGKRFGIFKTGDKKELMKILDKMCEVSY